MTAKRRLKRRRQKLRQYTRKLRNKRRASLSRLATAALALQSFGFELPASAQTRPEEATLRFQYVDYLDYQDEADRIRVRGPMTSLELPIGENSLVEGAYILDSVSGASPLYLNTLSGASAKGINDTRQAGDLKFTQFFERFSVAAGAAVSDEEDYTSYTGLLETKIWTQDKNTVLNFGVAGGDDDISATNDRELDESRQNFELAVGITQVLNQSAVFQGNLTYSHGAGYFSDPYKPFDNRPRSRDAVALLLRFNQYVKALDASLHLDYRYSINSWDLQSHLAEIAWYQTFGEYVALRPSIRYYTQNEAEFFRGYFPPEESDGFYSADQRLSAFGGLTFGIKGYVNLPWDLQLYGGYEYLIQKPEYRIGGGTDEIDTFYARMFTIGFLKKFHT